MKKIYFLSLLTVSSFLGYSQNSVDCYNYYYKVFEERGAFNVEDGNHEDVIVSIRKGDQADCYEGKVTVADNAVTKIYLQFEDGTFEPYSPKFKSEYASTIKDGISRSQITMEDEIVNVFFIKKIRPKKKEYKKAKLIKIDDL